MTLAIVSDDLWVGAKDQPNRVIAGSLRNAFRGSLSRSVAEVEHWMGALSQCGRKPDQTPNAATPERWKEAMSSKVHGREGNNPDRRLRPRSVC